jgi:hypothetical protein
MLARSPNRNAAVKYLVACGAIAITVIDRDDVGVVIVGKTASGIIAARWWIAEQDAQRVASAARRLAGDGPDISSAIAAVQRSAGSTRRSHLTMLRAITSESSRRPKNTVESALASFYGQTIVTMRQFGL